MVQCVTSPELCVILTVEAAAGLVESSIHHHLLQLPLFVYYWTIAHSSTRSVNLYYGKH